MQSLLLCTTVLLAANAADRQSVILVIGAPGKAEYGDEFQQWADRWQEAAEQADVDFIQIGRDPHGTVHDKDKLQKQLALQLKASDEALWLVLIGHGTFDGKAAKMNLRGPDVTATELAEWLKPCTRPLAIINCASASAPFIQRLSGPNRVIVTSTTSGYEYNFARLGDYLSAAIGDKAADLDKDEQTSLLEAFLAAAAQVEEFYSRNARLATEHALVDDNGDALGTPASWFRGVRATKSAKDGAQLDGLRANQFHLLRNRNEQKMPLDMRTRRDQLESEVARLRRVKNEIGEDDYYELLEPIFIELAQLYERLDKASVPPSDNPKPAEQPATAADSG